MLRGVAVMGAVTYLPILWNVRGGGLIGGATLITLMLIVGLVGTLYGGHLADRIGRRPVLVGAGVLMAACLALIAWGSGLALWFGAALLGIPAFATFPLTTVEGQDIFPENRPQALCDCARAFVCCQNALAGRHHALCDFNQMVWIHIKPSL